MATIAVHADARWQALLRSAAAVRGHGTIPVEEGAPLPRDAAALVSALCDADSTRAHAHAAVRAGLHYVGGRIHDPFIEDVLAGEHTAAEEAGVVVVAGAGLSPLVGDLLTAVGASGRPAPSAVHVAYVLPDGVVGPARSAGQAALRLLRAPVRAVVRGEVTLERPGQHRRLAWFPQPVGPHHAAGIPAGEALTVPRHLPTAGTVRTYLALRTWQAELLQALAALAGHDRGARLLSRLLSAGAGDPVGPVLQGARWGCVAEIAGPDGVSRAWAWGGDVAGAASAATMTVVDRLLTTPVPPGACAPAEVAEPEDLLDELAGTTDLRWSVVRPGP